MRASQQAFADDDVALDSLGQGNESPAPVSAEEYVAAPSVTRVIGFVRSPEPKVFEYTIWRLADRSLARPMRLSLSEDQGDALVSSDLLRIWGMGPDKYSALRDFSDTFFAVLREYSSTSVEGLSEDAKDYLALLRSHVSE